MQNHFELFHLAPQFALDMSALDAAYREVQNRVHPDKFVSASDAEKRVAMQWATRANEAYQTLKNPLKRAAYLCELNGADLRTESNTAMPMAFLMQQMEWREALEDARMQKDVAALELLELQLHQQRAALLTQINAVLDSGDYHQAAQDVRQLMFLEKFGEDVSFAFEASEV
ncbi:Fe-S protein assembly co-chaperone HscB [Undibacterium arcticum]|uniref:Co-chaperone protein HscB homolog n=1 Tax=Undibacterium arcticum TaxID=1762892 RepID=A0ABV7F5X5_9BURK